MSEKRSLNVLRSNDHVDALRASLATDRPTPAAAPAPTGDALRDAIVEQLQTVYDPELPVNIYDLGLVYEIDVSPENAVRVRMTLTAPACPMADSIVRDVETKVRATPGVSSAKVELVWSPPWDKSRMTEAALLELGLL